jgi:hypothetical protein
MKYLIATIGFTLLTCSAAFSGPFQPFAALSEGKDCKIELDFPDGMFCGLKVPAESIRSWYYGQGTEVGNSNSMLMGQKFDFGVVVNSADGARVIPIRFLNPGTAKRFYIQMAAWTGKPSADGGTSPFPSWLDIAR